MNGRQRGRWGRRGSAYRGTGCLRPAPLDAVPAPLAGFDSDDDTRSAVIAVPPRRDSALGYIEYLAAFESPMLRPTRDLAIGPLGGPNLGQAVMRWETRLTWTMARKVGWAEAFLGAAAFLATGAMLSDWCLVGVGLERGCELLIEWVPVGDVGEGWRRGGEAEGKRSSALCSVCSRPRSARCRRGV
jgi:hypothetical protein